MRYPIVIVFGLLALAIVCELCGDKHLAEYCFFSLIGLFCGAGLSAWQNAKQERLDRIERMRRRTLPPEPSSTKE